MKFGKNLRNEIAETLPQWRDEFLAYKVLKKQVNLIAYINGKGKVSKKAKLGDTSSTKADIEEVGFMELLDYELEKVSKFFFDKEEEYVIRMKELKDRVGKLRTNLDKIQLKLDILEFHGEMVLLLHYSVTNFAGLLKIVKKHDKKTGMHVSLPSAPMPFFTTEMICQLLRECEVILTQFSHVNYP